MPRAICTSCRKPFSWHNRRGSSLKDLSSPCCSAPARSMTKEEREADWDERIARAKAAAADVK